MERRFAVGRPFPRPDDGVAAIRAGDDLGGEVIVVSGLVDLLDRADAVAVVVIDGGVDVGPFQDQWGLPSHTAAKPPPASASIRA